MTETDVSSSGGLSTKLMPELKQIASGLGIKSAGMKKADLVGAIRAARSGGQKSDQANGQNHDQDREQNGGARQSERPAADAPEARTSEAQPESGRQENGAPNRRTRNDKPADDKQADDKQANDRQPGDKQNDRQQVDRQNGQGGQNEPQQNDEEGGTRRNRRRRGRDRSERQGGNTQAPAASRGNRNEPDTSILEDDVLSPCAGILDVLDNYAFVRTTGYLPGPDDVYVSLSMVRKLGLRRGDAITGQVRQPREGERKEKFNPLVKIDSVNGGDPEASRDRVEFTKLTPIHPGERLRMETSADNLIGRVVDIAAPIGKGQRGLVVAPTKAGKTMVLRSIAESVSANNPECHLMVVLVDERPEEVTEFQRSVTGEVVSSTFDRPATDHTVVAELAIERAKRLVELGHDVVVLLDGITRLARAYNLAGPASGRALAGGVDSAALYPPKKLFGAARNIEDGGSLTIIATALVESDSATDEVIYEEFQGTGNMELRLHRDLADKRIFPAIDAVASGTRREELLMSPEELAIVAKLRRTLASLDPEQALELLLGRLRKAQNNLQFLRDVERTMPAPNGGEQ